VVPPCFFSFFFQAEDGIRGFHVTGVQTCALPILLLTSADGPELWSQVVFLNRLPEPPDEDEDGEDGPRERPPVDVTLLLPMTSRSEEHTSELQSRENLVCRLLLEKKNQHPA